MFGGFGEVHRGGLRFLRGGRHLHGGFVDRRDQGAQRFDREVDRVGDRAGDVFGDRRLDREVAFGERSHFVEQAQNGFLVALVEFGGDLVALALARIRLTPSNSRTRTIATTGGDGAGDGRTDSEQAMRVGWQLVDALTDTGSALSSTVCESIEAWSAACFTSCNAPAASSSFLTGSCRGRSTAR